MIPDAPVWPQLEPLVAALEADLKLPRSTRVFPVSTEALTRVAKVFESACHRTLDVRLRFDTRALCSTWPQGRAQKDGTWHLDAFINTFMLPPPIAKWFDGATQVDPVDDVEATAQDEAFAEGAVVDAPLLVFALGCFWSAWLIHHGQGRWVGPETIDLDQADQAPPGLTVSGCVSFTFPFGRIASRLRTPGDTLWATGHRLVNDAVPPIGLAFSMDDAVVRAHDATVRAWCDHDDLESEYSVTPTAYPDPGLAWPVHAWASGKHLEVVLRDTDLAAGDFVRRCKQLVDLLDQIAQVAPQPALRTTARRAVDAVMRGVVAADRID